MVLHVCKLLNGIDREIVNALSQRNVPGAFSGQRTLVLGRL
jgi:hypothetical protein